MLPYYCEISILTSVSAETITKGRSFQQNICTNLCLACAVWGCIPLLKDHPLWQITCLDHLASDSWQVANSTVMRKWNGCWWWVSNSRVKFLAQLNCLSHVSASVSQGITFKNTIILQQNEQASNSTYLASVCFRIIRLHISCCVVWIRNQLDVTFVLSLISRVQVAQHVSGNHVPIFRSWAHGCPKHVEQLVQEK